MKRSILIALGAAALNVAAAPAGFARDVYRDDDRHYPAHDRRYDWGRDRGYGGFVIRFHLDGGRGRVHAKSEDRAHRIEDLLRSVGVDAFVDRGCVVHYRLRGEGRVVRRSHEDAHRLAQKLEGYGFHTDVRHE